MQEKQAKLNDAIKRFNSVGARQSNAAGVFVQLISKQDVFSVTAAFADGTGGVPSWRRAYDAAAAAKTAAVTIPDGGNAGAPADASNMSMAYVYAKPSAAVAEAEQDRSANVSWV